jgi:hypothetical protein
MASPASAATLTIVDTFGGSETTWTLDVQDNCGPADCVATLSAFFDGGGGTNAYAGFWLDAFQFSVTSPNINPPTDADMTATNTVLGGWDTIVGAGVNANECGAGAQHGVCSEWNGANPGFLIANNATYTWSFLVDWTSALDVAEAGTIRAAFNTDQVNGKGNPINLNIFSPGEHQFSTTTPTTTPSTTPATPELTTPSTPSTTEQVAEPTLLTLLGGGLVMASRRLRRKKA